MLLSHLDRYLARIPQLGTAPILQTSWLRQNTHFLVLPNPNYELTTFTKSGLDTLAPK